MNMIKKISPITLICLFFLSTLSFRSSATFDQQLFEIVIGPPLIMCGIVLYCALYKSYKKKMNYQPIIESELQIESDVPETMKSRFCKYLRDNPAGNSIATVLTCVGSAAFLHGATTASMSS